MPTMKELYSELEITLKNNEKKNKGVNGVFQFDIGGDDPMDFYFKLVDGVSTMGEGSAENPTITFTMTDVNYKKMVAGKLNGTMAVMTGKVKVKGEMSLAMKLESVMKP